MKHAPLIMLSIAGLLLATGCVRRTITDRPGWPDPSTGKLMYITPNYQKTLESRIVWFWEPEFYKTREKFKATEDEAAAAE